MNEPYDFRVLNIIDEKHIDNYKHIFKSFRFHNPFNSIELIKPADEDENTLICFILAKDNTPIVLMPIYLRKLDQNSINKDLFDVSSPYGYSGPMFNPNIDNQDLRKFWLELDSWYSDNNVVTEFIRFNLNYNYRCYTGLLDPTLINVVGNLKPIEDIWHNFKRKVRNNVRRAEKSELRFEIHYGNLNKEMLKKFYDIYIPTMERNKADDKYFFSISYFEQFELLVSNNPKECAIAFVYKDDLPISSELLLISDEAIYSYLGGTNATYFSMRPNDYLKYNVMKWGYELGKKYYILGGGRENNDGLFNYKKAFFPIDQNVIYYTGRKIVNKELYKLLIEEKIEMEIGDYEKHSLNNFFPYYRMNNELV